MPSKKKRYRIPSAKHWSDLEDGSSAWTEPDEEGGRTYVIEHQGDERFVAHVEHSDGSISTGGPVLPRKSHCVQYLRRYYD